MIASPPIETAVETPSPAAVSEEEISVVIPPERDITPIEPGAYALAASFAGPPMPPILQTPGAISPRQFGPMIRAPRRLASSTIWATSRRGNPLGDDDDQLDPVLDRLEDRVLGEGGGDGDDRAVDRPP